MARNRRNSGVIPAAFGIGGLLALAMVAYLRWYDRHLRQDIGKLVQRLVKGYMGQ